MPELCVPDLKKEKDEDTLHGPGSLGLGMTRWCARVGGSGEGIYESCDGASA